MSDVAELLRALVRVDTSNPPGNETAAAAVLRDYLEPTGITCELVARDPDRANFVARVPGTGGGPTLLFLGHLDVVPANGDRWSVEPFAGVLKHDQVWGRGAVDMKCWLAACAVALAQLHADGFRPNGDLLLVACADEEDGSAEVGAPWLVEQRPDLRADFVVNEGSGEAFDVDGRRYYLVGVGEKSSTHPKLRAIGRSGDPSSRRREENALVTVARLVAKLGEHQPEWRFEEEARLLLDAVAPAADGEPAEERVERLRAAHPFLDLMLPPLLTPTTLTPSLVRAHGKVNMIPDAAETTLSATSLPGVTKDDVEGEIVRALGGRDGYELEVEEPLGGTRSPVDTPLWSAIDGFLAEHDPGATPVPYLCLGYTDSHVWREKFGSVAYGFVPVRGEQALTGYETKHGADERIAVSDLEFQVEAAVSLARRIGRSD